MSVGPLQAKCRTPPILTLGEEAHPSLGKTPLLNQTRKALEFTSELLGMNTWSSPPPQASGHFLHSSDIILVFRSWQSHQADPTPSDRGRNWGQRLAQCQMTPTNGVPRSHALLLNFDASIWETWYPLGVVLTSNWGELVEKSSFLPDFSKIDSQTLIFTNGLKEPVWHLPKLLWQKERENEGKKEGKKERDGAGRKAREERREEERRLCQ